MRRDSGWQTQQAWVKHIQMQGPKDGSIPISSNSSSLNKDEVGRPQGGSLTPVRCKVVGVREDVPQRIARCAERNRTMGEQNFEVGDQIVIVETPLAGAEGKVDRLYSSHPEAIGVQLDGYGAMLFYDGEIKHADE
jgi:hypothetical protein